MQAHNANNQHKKFWFCFLAAVLLAGSIVVLQTFQADGAAAGVIYSHGVLRAAITYQAAHAGEGQLTMEVLDPDDKVIAGMQRPAEVAEGPGSWQEQIRFAKPVALDELVWHRLRYRFVYSDGKTEPIEGIESISQVLRTPVLHILGQQSYLAGGDAAVRVIVTDSKNQPISGPSSVRIELLAPGKKPQELFSGRLNRRGTTEAQFRLPAGLTGSYQLRYAADTFMGATEFTQQVKLEDKVSILLTTEKPIYQPGQTIHVRALALDRSDHEAAVNRNLTFEVEDSRGNKVFKKATETDKFGIASAEFGLADEVNLGTYHLRALMGDADAPANTAEIALNVERYVLPKFKVAIELGGKESQSKRGYRPGDHVTGTVRANYFFGKAVEGGEITVKASSMDVAVFDAGTAHGKTGPDGTFHFDLTLPGYFAGHPLNQGSARVLIEASVKDSAGHSETRGQPITVSESPLIVTAVPEGGTLAPGLDNQVFILASYADGTPASADLKVRSAGSAEQHVVTDNGGVAIVHLHAGEKAETLEVDAADREGNRLSTNVPLKTREGHDQILLRTERAVYHAGDPIALKVFSTQKRGTAYVDIVKEGQTVLTRDIDIENGQAQLTLTATPEMAGTVDFNVYVFGRDAQPVGDHRLVFVQPADELKIEARAENAIYKPGDEARIRFRVTNSRGEGVSAALGLQVVDEAVFALAEKQPGFAKVFFYLEQEVLKPRYEIHSIGMPQVVETSEKSNGDQRDRAARALFSATEMVNENKFETEVGRTMPTGKYGVYAQRYQAHFYEQVRALAQELSVSYSGESDLNQLAVKLARSGKVNLRDAWGTEMRLEPVGWRTEKDFYMIRSAGPDKQFQSGDDLSMYLQVVSRKIVGEKSSGDSAIQFGIEHERGAFNHLAEITGTAIDQLGAAAQGAIVSVRSISSRKWRKAVVGIDGQFKLSGLPPGEYSIEITSQSESLRQTVTLDVRDRAVLSVFLRHQDGIIVAIPPGTRWQNGDIIEQRLNRVFDMKAGAAMPVPAVSETVEVTANAPVIETSMSVSNTVTAAKVEPAAHVRSYFPEALYINPEIITDRDGRASITIPVADSITTWRMAMMASTAHGALGSATSSLKVFQDFFVDLDLPVTLTQGDRISIPVAVYNYAGGRGSVDLKLQPDSWYELVDDSAEKNVTVDAARVGGSQFTLEARRIGKFKLTLAARMQGGENRADVVVKEIEVIPNGREQNTVFNGRLESEVQHEVAFPAAAVPEASKIFVRLYPGPLSQVIEGMDSILSMPGGCFEQTSSSTYPNVLALDYMKRTKKLTPEVHAKAEGYIANGYQRLLTFEVAGGGFSWFGNAPANKILTAYGLMEFSDMSKVHDVDHKLIERTQQWLASQQQEDGSWKPDTDFINEGATNHYNSDVLRITAYIAWSLENTGYQGQAVDKARHYVESHMGSSARPDAYTLAVLANFAADYGKDRDFARRTAQMLLDARTETEDQAWWSASETSVYATGESASIETTGLAIQALLKSGEASATTRKALKYLAAKKDARGTWGTTQATIMALRALLLSTEKGTADVNGTVAVLLNGKPVEKLTLNADNNDLLHQFVFKGADLKGSESKVTDSKSGEANRADIVEIKFEGKGGLAYQIVGQYYLPWDKKPESEALSIDVAYDRTHLAQDDIATATATVKNNLNKAANMVMVDLGIPPGFDLLSEDLDAYREKGAGLKSGRLEKFSQTATQAILYFDSFAPGETVTLRFRLRAKYPIRARTFQSRVYEYYNPEVSSLARPALLEVR
jgi:hypothetical protein